MKMSMSHDGRCFVKTVETLRYSTYTGCIISSCFGSCVTGWNMGKELHPNPKYPLQVLGFGRNMSLSEAAGARFELIKCKFKTMCRRCKCFNANLPCIKLCQS